MKQRNRIKAGGAVIALGVCAGAALYLPAAARSAGEDAANYPPEPSPSTHKFGGPTNQTFGGHGPGGQRPGNQNGGGPNNDGRKDDGQGPPMRREEMLAQELRLTPEQQAKVQAIYEQERAQMRLIHEKTRAGIAAILSAEQKTQFAQMPIPGPPENGPRGGQDRQNNFNDGNGRDGSGRDNNGRDGNRPPMQGEMEDEDHGRPVAQIARELGVTPEQFRAAFRKVQPAPRGERPTEAQREANRKVLAETLGVSPERLDEVMDKYRPEGPDGGPPRNDDAHNGDHRNEED